MNSSRQLIRSYVFDFDYSSKNEVDIDLAELPAGVYIVRMEDGYEEHYERIDDQCNLL